MKDHYPCRNCGKSTHVDDLYYGRQQCEECYQKSFIPCHSCGALTHLEDIDGKDDGSGDFNILECEKCYGEGYAPLFCKGNPPSFIKGNKKT